MREHFVIPDTQVKPGVPTNHLTAAGNYIVDRRPDTIIHLGDHWDMHSLSSYDKGTKKAEGARYQEDIDAGLKGMVDLLRPIMDLRRKQKKQKIKQYSPQMVFLMGNHEQRIERHVNANPALEGKLGYQDLKLKELGWYVADFREPVEVDGVYYAHYFYNPMSGRPYGGRVHTKLQNLGFSFTMGHQQGLEVAIKSLNNGKTIRGLVAGSFYQHDEEYKGPQANDHWHGCIYKHEVKDGNYNIMELSMDYLLREWL
jgi:hypothetical protein